MTEIELVKVKHKYKQGGVCGDIEPNITQSCLFTENGKVVGFYIEEVPQDLIGLLDVANAEFLSKRVPKSNMTRVNTGNGEGIRFNQYSTIIGSIPPKAVFRRPYPTISSVHGKKSAHNFIKAMYMICGKAEKIIKKYMPEQYAVQQKAFESVADKWKIGSMYTSSISNFNISANFHVDTRNVKDTVNIILTKRKASKGGCLYVPDYDACIEQKDNSLLVYPAWKDMHGVTPIVPTNAGGYRNSLIFYPLNSFLGTK